MKKTILLFLLFVAVISLFTVLFPVRLHDAGYYYTGNYLDMNKKSLKKINAYYFYKSECGYFSYNDGFVNVYYTAPDQFLTANIFGYVLYNKVGDLISLINPEGKKIKDINTFGYPYIPGDYPFFYVIKTNGTGFFSYTFKGDELFKTVDYTSIITSISCDKNGNTLVSNLDGKTYMYSATGEVVFYNDAKTGDSQVKMTKSNAIDETSQYAAICTGLNPEYVEIYQVKNGKLIKRIKTDTNFRYSSLLQFNKQRLYFESEGKLSYFDIKTKKNGNIAINGKIDELQFDQKGNIIVISKDDDFYYLTIFNNLGYKRFYKEFPFKIDNIKVIDKTDFYFKTPGYVVIVSLRNPV